MEKKNKYWFKNSKYNIPHIPNAWQGWFMYGLYIGFLIVFFIAVDMNSHSVSDTLYGFLPKFLIVSSLFFVILFVFGEESKFKKKK